MKWKKRAINKQWDSTHAKLFAQSFSSEYARTIIRLIVFVLTLLSFTSNKDVFFHFVLSSFFPFYQFTYLSYLLSYVIVTLLTYSIPAKLRIPIFYNCI